MILITGRRTKFGENPDDLINKYAWMLNESIKDRPDDMTIGVTV